MTTQLKSNKDSIDRRAPAAAGVIAVLAAIMLVLQFVGKPAEAYAAPLFWVEFFAELSVVAALAFALPMSLREADISLVYLARLNGEAASWSSSTKTSSSW